MGVNDGGSTPFGDGSDDDRPSAPQPPHERVWRHPSEIGYAEFRTLPPPDIGRTGRGLVVFSLISGCLLLVGLLVVVRPDNGRNNTTDIVRLSSSNLSVASISSRTYSSDSDAAPLAVHISDTPFLLTTSNAIVDQETDPNTDAEIEIHLADGEYTTARVVIDDSRLAILAIDDDLTPTEVSMPFTFGVSGGQLVTVALTSGESSYVVEEIEVDTADGTMVLRSLSEQSSPESLVEGAPVVDRTGRFVGLISIVAGRTLLVPADAAARLLRELISDDGDNDATQAATTLP